MNANRYDTPIHVDSEGHKRPGPRVDGADGSDLLGKHYDQHLIVMQQDKADVGVMGAYLQNKHLFNTALWQWDEGGVFRRIAGIELEPGAITKLTLLGHGNRWFRTLGGRDGFELGAQVSVIQADHDLAIPKVYAFGCYADNCDADGRSLVGDLRTALRGFGIDSEVKGPDGPIIATPDGRKVKLDAPVPGSMNKDRHDVIVIEEDDALVGLMAGFRFQRHPLTSGLVLAGAGNDLTALNGVFKRGAEVDVDLFGHGERRDGKRLLGGRDAKALAKQVATLRDRLDLKVKKVHLFSCKSADCDETGRSMVDDMSDELRAQGIDARVKGHSGGIELTPEGRTIKSPTRQERSELTGGWDKVELPKPADPAPVSPPMAVVAEPAPEKYVRRVIGIGDDSSEAYAAAMGLYEKHAKSAVVMERFRDAWIPTRTSNGEKVDGLVKVQLIGVVRNGRIGNRDAGDVARDVADFHARYGGTVAKVELVDAGPPETDATERDLIAGVSNKLHDIGIDTNVVGRKAQKPAVPEGVPGSLGRSSPMLSLGDMQRMADKPGDTLYRDADGQAWSVKAANNDADFANNEILAGKLLSLAGVPVPELRLVELDGELGGGIGIASRAIPGAEAVDVHADAEALAAAREDFVAHAYIGKVDTFGIAGGTYVRDPSGAMTSIDHAATLRYGRRGAPRGDRFGPKVEELKDMRTTFGMTQGILRDMSAREFRNGLHRVVDIPDAAILSVVAEFGPRDAAERDALGQRLLERKADLADTLRRLDPDLTSGGLPESLAPKLTDRERAILGRLHELDDFFFLGDDEAPVTPFLFRGDKRPPATIFASGFPPWIKWPTLADDLAKHQVRVDRKHANLVSLSKVPSAATAFANGGGAVSGNFLHVIHGQRGLDMNRTLRSMSKYPEQREVAVPDGVAPEMIVGAFEVSKAGIVPGSFQPNPVFEDAMDRAGFGARQRTLLDRHALVSSSLEDVQGQWFWDREPGLEAILRHDRAKLEWNLDGLYREQEAAARRDANRRDFFDTTLKE